MNIRAAKTKDAASIARVIVDTWRSTYVGIVPQHYLDSLSYEVVTDRWQERLANTDKIWPGWSIFVAENDTAKVFGFAGGGPSQDHGLDFTAELGFIYLLKTNQRQGTGRLLLTTVALKLIEKGLNNMLVWVFSANPYRAFYEALGGQQVAERYVDRYEGHLSEIAYGWRDLRLLAGIKNR
jgi:L-amino acid N-acyltransferase YncA